ncbi:MAG: GH32 C-terminal domain-containing protein, partial [Atopobiaceae bacterium]
PARGIDDLRVLVDRSSVEAFANGGELVASTRWYPRSISDGLLVRLEGDEGEGACVWPMGDAMHTIIAAAAASQE